MKPISVVVGAQALDLLGDTSFSQNLADLYEHCPWSSRFQSQEFLTIWYGCYSEAFSPILLYQFNDRQLSGFLALAKDKKDKRIVVAGSYHAEYQCWLALPEHSECFLQDAMGVLKCEFAAKQLKFKYLPADVNMTWSYRPLACGGQAITQTHNRPMIDVRNSKDIANSLKKSGNRSRLNRLKRLGEVQLRHLHHACELEQLIDQITADYDLRQGAMNDVCPFHDDPNKTQFYLNMMRQKDLLHASVLTVGDTIAAAHFGVRNGDTLALGVYSFASSLARYSPGKLLLLLLAADLPSQGFVAFDLTPGGSWKDRFANQHEKVVEVDIYFRRRDALRAHFMNMVAVLGRRCLERIGLNLDQVRLFVRDFQGRSLRHLLMQRRKESSQVQNTRIYRCDNFLGFSHALKTGYDRNNVGDLLRVHAEHHCLDRKGFLAESCRRIEEGQEFLTHVDGRGGAFSCWLVDANLDGIFPSLKEKFDCKGKTVVLYDCCFWSEETATQDRRQWVETAITDAARSAEEVLFASAENDVALHETLDALGFQLAATLENCQHFRPAHSRYPMLTATKRS